MLRPGPNSVAGAPGDPVSSLFQVGFETSMSHFACMNLLWGFELWGTNRGFIMHASQYLQNDMTGHSEQERI